MSSRVASAPNFAMARVDDLERFVPSVGPVGQGQGQVVERQLVIGLELDRLAIQRDGLVARAVDVAEIGRPNRRDRPSGDCSRGPSCSRLSRLAGQGATSAGSGVSASASAIAVSRAAAPVLYLRHEADGFVRQVLAYQQNQQTGEHLPPLDRGLSPRSRTAWPRRRRLVDLRLASRLLRDFPGRHETQPHGADAVLRILFEPRQHRLRVVGELRLIARVAIQEFGIAHEIDRRARRPAARRPGTVRRPASADGRSRRAKPAGRGPGRALAAGFGRGLPAARSSAADPRVGPCGPTGSPRAAGRTRCCRPSGRLRMRTWAASRSRCSPPCSARARTSVRCAGTDLRPLFENLPAIRFGLGRIVGDEELGRPLEHGDLPVRRDSA